MDHAPDGRSGNEYMPLPSDTVARTPPPSVLKAVTVAPATGSLAGFLTSPTTAPIVALEAAVGGAVGTSADTGCATRSAVSTRGKKTGDALYMTSASLDSLRSRELYALSYKEGVKVKTRAGIARL